VPLVLFFLFLSVGTTYYFTRKALTGLAETWLETRLTEALQIAEEQMAILQRYGLESVPASIEKAKMDAGAAIAAIEVGEQGFVFVVSTHGIVTLHPDKDMVGRDMSGEPWFAEIDSGEKQLVYWGQANTNMARYAYFEPWEWVVLATSPEKEIYGVANKMKPYILYLAILGSIAMSVALMFLTRRLTAPLMALKAGADRIGKGDLQTRIAIPGRDEFSHLADVFNQMAAELQNTLTELQQREEHFRSIIENASDIITILDTGGTIVYASPSIERILGYTPEELIGRNAFDFIHPDDRTEIEELYREELASPAEMTPTEFRFQHRDGTWRTLEGTSENMLNHPAVGGFVMNSRDITERKLALEALNESHQELELRVQERTAQFKSINKELKEFAYVVSHDLKAPLRAISQLTHWISEDYAGAFDREGRDMMDLILKRVKRMDGLIDGVLNYSRIGRIKEHAQTLDLNTLVGELIENAMPPPHIQVGIEGELPVVRRDPIRMEQVFQNLIDNAITYMDKPAGVVKIGCEDEGTQWMFSVSDNGPGIDRPYHDKIFQIFQTLAPRDEHESSGVGLTLVKKIIEQYDGSIWVASEPGKGSTFYFTLPKRENSHATA
jgi:PAS domain S-box-containing protein